MRTIITLEDLRKRWYNMENMECRPSFSKVKENHIFDEDKSVRWNKEEVIRHNEKYDKEVKDLNTKKNKKRDEILNDIYTYIQQEVGHNLSRSKAIDIYDYVISNTSYNSRVEALNNLYDIIELANVILSPEKKKEHWNDEYER